MPHLPTGRRRRVTAVAAAACALLAVPALASAAGLTTDRTDQVRKAVVGGQARNVILLIGDGMGDSEITIGRNYAKGAAGRLAMDTLPLTGAYTTYSVQKGTDVPDYVTDSAASATGWATGTKTYDGALSVNTNGKVVPTLLEIARDNGYRTGNVSTAEIEDATPASQVAHVPSRSCYGPVETLATCPTSATENGGLGSIAEQLANSRADVVLGGGAAAFSQVVQGGRFKGITVEQQAQVNGYAIVKSAAELAAVKPYGTKPVLGLFAPGNLDQEYTPLQAAVGGTGPAQPCTPNAARTATQPRLVDMTNTALSLLGKRSQDQPKGFFLQIEGASIDKRDHAADLCGQIGETVAFDAAVARSLEYQRNHPDTLVIVTADHGHSAQIVDSTATPGGTATVLTADGAPMTVNYGTAPLTGSQQHTGTQVRVAAGGPQAANVVGVTDQTDLFSTMSRALGLATPIGVQLLGINDFHGNLQPPTGSSGTIAGQPAGGAAYLAGHLADLRRGRENSLTVAAGDLIGASPLISALFHDEPTIEALNAMHLDVSAVGNHEFDEGAAELRRIQDGGCHPTDGCDTGHEFAGADFPYLAANVVSAETGKPLLAPYVVKQVKGAKIGFIGMTLEGTPAIVSAAGVKGLTFLDEADTANRYAKELQKQGVQSIVVLLHEGGFQNPSTAGINDCQGISGPIVDIVNRMAPSIDAVLSAHTHQAYNCNIAGKLVTSGSSFGRLVTDIELTISPATKDVTSARAENVVVTREAQYQDAGVQALVDDYARRSAEVASAPVGSITADISKTAKANGESPLGDVIADSQLAATDEQGAQVAFMNPGGIRADLVNAPSGSEAPGVVTYGEAFTVQPFNNLLTTLTYTGDQLRAVLEQQYALGTTLQPAGITYRVSASAPVGSKVSDVVVGGTPLDPAGSYRLTVNNFLAGGGDGFSTLTAGTDAVNSGLDIDAFTAYLGSHPGLAPPAADRITLVP